MTSRTQIVGVVLVRNEDLNIAWVLRNSLDFCDRIIVLDNYSTDCTYQAVRALANANPKIELRRWRNAKTSQKALREFYGTDTWIFWPDGDEVYDPAGLAVIRTRILSGEFNGIYNLVGDALNCTAIDTGKKTATGYAELRFGKLNNFRLVRGWENENRQRLHGHPIFNDKIDAKSVYIGDDWDKSIFRCLHLCFMQRSSGIQKHRFDWIGYWRRRKKLIKPNPAGNPYNARPGPGDSVEYKMKVYATGEVVTRDIAGFGARL